MKIKCDYCGSMVDEESKSCPNCGAPLSGVNRFAGEEPKTIEQLQEWYTNHNLPPENVTRFFIGKDIKEPKAFGIYKNSTGDFVVYKNKSDGSRAVRYQGKDEAYAVNELYQRLKSEIADQKNKNAGKNGSTSNGRNRKKKKNAGNFIIYAFILGTILSIILVAILDDSPRTGYYRYKGNDYYYQNSAWYYYNSSTDDWEKASNSSELSETINSDNDDEYQTNSHTGKSFENSTWYDEGDDSSWDSDNNWDSNDSWDSNDTDWDSDW